ncbi:MULTISPECIES: DUF6435 family protein [Salinivibrio]|nr:MULTISPECIES: DUF6435 family protein [Salinivibrio]MPS30980.1 Lacal_2735 family protein [Salinivibrio sp. VYel7]MPX89479.1 Lacal_2735 family protein [Salinivibrio sp. VYel1]MPX92381.1 Lacal_2735 family protein [Salinivibrio sp. VYel9]MPX97043.1 Lacal_2735 family protein [Salinivibrio sp. VYel6]MPX98613.1 Lacal_2735 family protein [Salinivibrio sp. VYel4]
MLSFLKPNPVKKLKKQYEAKQQQAFQAQRNGDIRGYSLLTEEAEKIDKQIKELENNA